MVLVCLRCFVKLRCSFAFAIIPNRLFTIPCYHPAWARCLATFCATQMLRQLQQRLAVVEEEKEPSVFSIARQSDVLTMY